MYSNMQLLTLPGLIVDFGIVDVVDVWDNVVVGNDDSDDDDDDDDDDDNDNVETYVDNLVVTFLASLRGADPQAFIASTYTP